MSPHEIIAEILQFNSNGEDLPKQTLRFIREANTEDREVRRSIEQLHKKYVLMNACGSRNIEPNAPSTAQTRRTT